MVKARVLLCALASLAVGVAGCGCDDCEYKEYKYPAYANKSGVMVKIIVIQKSDIIHSHENNIADGDTLHYTGEEWSGVYCGFVTFVDCNKPIKMELHFQGESEKCLVFDGPIEHNGIDMRSWNSYKKGKVERQENWADVEYVYTITPTLMQQAKESDCPPDI